MISGRTIPELAERLSVDRREVASWLVDWEERGLVRCVWTIADEALAFEVRSLALDASESEPDDGSAWREELDELGDVLVSCDVCREPLSASVRQRRGRFCSATCRQQARRTREAQRVA